MIPGRAEQLEGLLMLYAWLYAHPDVPVLHIDATVHCTGTDEEERARVDALAAQLGVTPELQAGGEHYKAKRDFGGGVNLSACAITAAHMARWQAVTSYDGAVEPNNDQKAIA